MPNWIAALDHRYINSRIWYAVRFLWLVYAYMVVSHLLLRNNLTLGGGWHIEYHCFSRGLFLFILIWLLIIFFYTYTYIHIYIGIKTYIHVYIRVYVLEVHVITLLLCSSVRSNPMNNDLVTWLIVMCRRKMYYNYIFSFIYIITIFNSASNFCIFATYNRFYVSSITTIICPDAKIYMDRDIM